MCCTFRFEATISIFAGSSRDSARSISAWRFTDFLCASRTMEPPTSRISRLVIWKDWMFPKDRSPDCWLLLALSGLEGSIVSMTLLSTSFLSALKSRRKSKCVVLAHLEQLLAARSASVKGPVKQVLILSTAASRGSSDSSWQKVLPTMDVCCQAMRLTLSRSLQSMPRGCLLLPMLIWMWFSCSSSMVSRMYSGLPIVTFATNCRSGCGTICSWTFR
mmetsp:Transcript_48811/g.139668  ORF Transcript_48811/g.139668 Transcript_48811/m.139668 type:complete len:218 (-) Transcript_48811:2525-3178(-)